MQKRSSRKRPIDPNELAVLIVAGATLETQEERSDPNGLESGRETPTIQAGRASGQEEHPDQNSATEKEPPPDSGKNPAAVALGRLGGLKGGKARAAKLSPEERRRIARKAAAARWEEKSL